MRRRLIILLIPILLLGVSAWGIYRLLWTPEGCRWALQTVCRLADLTCSAEKISGGLAGSLHIEGLEFRWPQGRIRMERLETVLIPGHLWTGQILFSRIRADHLTWEDRQRMTQPLNLTLPDIGGLLSRLRLEVRSFILEDLRYVYFNDPPLVLNRLQGALSWHYGVLAVNPLSLKDPHGSLQGRFSLAFSSPELRLEGEWVPLKETAGLDRITLEGHLKPGKKKEQLAGLLSIRGLKAGRERVLLQTDVGLAGEQVYFRNISLREKGRSGLVRGEGSLRYEPAGAAYEGALRLEGLDLSAELKRPTRLSGAVRLAGRGETLNGTFDLLNKGASWEAFHLNGRFRGEASGLAIELLPGEWLKGSLEGQIEVRWNEGMRVEGFLKGRQLQPGVIRSGWDGRINLEGRGRVLWTDQGLKEGRLEMNLLESRFQGKDLQGGIKLQLEQKRLEVESAVLQGRGFRFSGQGLLTEGLRVEARVDDLASLLPEGSGSLQAKGWVRWRNNRLAGKVFLEGGSLGWKDMRAGKVKLEAALDQEKKDTALEGRFRLRKPGYRTWEGESLSGDIRGTLLHQEIDVSGHFLKMRLRAALQGTYRETVWQGSLRQFSGETEKKKSITLQTPVALTISPDRIYLAPAVFLGEGEERLNVTADLNLQTLTGSAALNWHQIDLARLGPYLEGGLSGRTTGQAEIHWLGDDRLHLQARVDLNGTWPFQDRNLQISRAGFSLLWDDSGLKASWNAETANQARVWGRASSAEKGTPGLPRQIQFSGQWEGWDVRLLSERIHPAFQPEGRCSGQAAGEWRSGTGFRVKGEAKVAGGALAWKDQKTQLTARIKTAEAGIDWGDNRLQGNLLLELEKYGKITGKFSLPLMSRFPVAMEGKGPLEVQLQGDIQERGVLASLWPEAVFSGQGRIQGQVSVRGTWADPNLQGGLELTEPEVEIRSLGIRIRNTAVKGIFDRDRIRLTELTLTSGPGALKGAAVFHLKDWKISALEGKLTGDRFQFINRPGLEAQGSPRLEFSGTPERLKINGVLDIPEALFSGSLPEGFKQASSDTVILDRPAKKEKEIPYQIGGEIKVVLGKAVRIKAFGLEGNLEGAVQVLLKGVQEIQAQGEIKVVQGTYLIQGQKLKVSRGRFVFNGPPQNPGLDLLALRFIRASQSTDNWTEEVRAGIVVTGTVNKPVVRLYSQPPFSDSDILSYILFGQPVSQGGGSQNLAILGKAARSLLGKGFQGSLPGGLNPDVIEVQSGGSDVSQSMVTVGKYLDPRLFLGFGGSLFSNSYQVILRYSLSRHLEVETKGGTSSGGGIYYRLNFQ